MYDGKRTIEVVFVGIPNRCPRIKSLQNFAFIRITDYRVKNMTGKMKKYTFFPFFILRLYFFISILMSWRFFIGYCCQWLWSCGSSSTLFCESQTPCTFARVYYTRCDW